MAKTQNQLQISVSNGSFVDEGEGVISFPNGLTITDDSVMRSGTRYDIQSLDVSNYGGQLTGDHKDSLGTLIGKVQGVVKEGNRIAIQGIKYAVKENPYARLAYDLLVGGFSNSFSIETIGPWPNEEDRTYYAHELVGLSQVVVPNNYNAKINQFNEIVHNSLERSQQDGLDISGVEQQIMSKVNFVKSEAVEEESMTKQKNDAPVKEETPVTEPTEVEEVKAEAVETEKVEEATPVVEETKVEEVTEAPVEAPAESEVKVESEAVVQDVSGTAAPQQEEPKEEAEQAEPAVEEVTEPVEEPKVETEAQAEVEAEEEPKEEVENKTNKNEETLEMTAEQIAEIVANAVKPFADELAATKELAQNALDAQAKEPEFVKEEVVANSYDNMSHEELFAKQLNAAVAAERMGSVEGRQTLNEINARNLQALKDAKIVNTAITLEDLGNFVIAPELYTQVVGVRTNYQGLIDATQWRETNSLEFSWLSRSSDINMQPVAIGFDGDVTSPDTTGGTYATGPTNDRLKPVSVPTYGPNSDKMEELAAVTPISINTIKFAAADILADVAEGYRNDYDRKRAELVIARLQQAVNTTGNKTTYDISDGIIQFAQAVADMSDVTTVGSLVMNSKSLAMIKGAAIDASQESLLLEIGQGSILGTPYVVVPNDLLPTLNSAETRTFAVQGSNVTIDQAVFYVDLRTFTGRSSGGLKYDVDGSASYEVAGKVYSAYQRNEVVIRGSFFRGGVIKDPNVVSSIAATAVS